MAAVVSFTRGSAGCGAQLRPGRARETPAGDHKTRVLIGSRVVRNCRRAVGSSEKSHRRCLARASQPPSPCGSAAPCDEPPLLPSEDAAEHQAAPTSSALLPSSTASRLLEFVPRFALLGAVTLLTCVCNPGVSWGHGGVAMGLLPHPPAAEPTVGLLRFLAAQWGHILMAGWTGLVAGVLHTLTGPDHLAALAPLTIGRSRVESAAIGALWGCGHDAGQVLFGVLFVLLKERLHLDFFRLWGARIVGLTLVVIGALGLNEARIARQEASAAALLAPLSVSSAAAPPDFDTSVHGHSHGRKTSFGVATFVTGIVHGLQPDALLVVLPALAMPSRIAGASFLALFLLGTVLAMGTYTAFIGSCSDALRERVPGITWKLSGSAAVLALLLGTAMVVGELLGVTFL